MYLAWCGVKDAHSWDTSALVSAHRVGCLEDGVRTKHTASACSKSTGGMIV